jgi:hypothetical protein
MPPFDPFFGESMLDVLKRLMDERDQSWRFTKKGDKRPAYDIESAKQAKRAKVKASRDAKIETVLARTRAEHAARKPAPGHDIASRMIRAMEPGKYYGMGDIMRLAGAARHERGKVRQVLVKRRWVEMTRNASYSGRNLNPWEIMGGAEPEPETLYRLTEVGLARRAELELKKPGH